MPLLPLLLILFACSPSRGTAGEAPKSEAPSGFWEHWGDGKAEIATYQLTQPRYGQLRKGEAVLIVVTETFTKNQRVKSDGGHKDEFPVIKLNDSRHFQTGIYDYRVLSSTFLPLDGSLPWGIPTKLTLSVQEWCGQVWDEWIFDPGRFRRSLHSYFDGEGDRLETGKLPVDSVMIDALPIAVRGLVGEGLKSGESRTIRVGRRLLDGRFEHKQDIEFVEGTLERGAQAVQVVVPAGEFAATRWRLSLGVTEWMEWDVEVGGASRLLAWRGEDGEEGMLIASSRQEYWKLNHEGDERVRAELGLPIRVLP